MAIISFITLATGPNVINLFTSVSYNFLNKLECLSMASLSSLVYCLWVRSGAYLIQAAGRLRPYLLRLGWKGLSGTNTLAYLEKFVNYGRKKYYNIGPRPEVEISGKIGIKFDPSTEFRIW